MGHLGLLLSIIIIIIIVSSLSLSLHLPLHNLSYKQHTMKTPVYVKIDAKEQFLLSEGVCRQLDIVTYHSDVVPGQEAGGEVYVPMVRVMLTQTVKLKPEESAVVDVRIMKDSVGIQNMPPRLITTVVRWQAKTGVQIPNALVQQCVRKSPADEQIWYDQPNRGRNRGWLGYTSCRSGTRPRT